MTMEKEQNAVRGNGVLLAAEYESQSRDIYKINKHQGR